VRQGQVWANSEQSRYPLEVVTKVPSLRMMNARGAKLLTCREEQVVALVADGLTSRRHRARTQPERAHGKKVSLPHFRQVGNFQPSRARPLCRQPRGHRQAEWVAGGGI
jgi:hypothetical protein